MESRTLTEEFYLLLGRMTHRYSHLEFNVGLRLRYLINPQNPSAANSHISGRSMAMKLETLRKLVGQKLGQKHPELIKLVNEWFRDMDQFRATRNKYVHGLWNVGKASNPDKGPIQFNHLHWEYESHGKSSTYGETEYMELNEFAVVVDELELLSKRFSELLEEVTSAIKMGVKIEST